MTVLHGAAVGLGSLNGLSFRADRPYTGCRICGAVFQSLADRDPQAVYDKQPAEFDFNPLNVSVFAMGLRKGWSHTHAKSHSEREHENLRKSGAWCTPEAAHRLAAFGTIPIVDLVMNNEVEDALRTAPSVPDNDAEG